MNARAIIEKARAIFLREPTIQRFNGPKLTVCGDVHGQLNDMHKIFALNGSPSASNPYLFNGDFVDRGPNSLGCILTLLSYKLMDPSSIFLNRGNHEFSEMNAYYGFRKELGNDTVWRLFNELFELFPVATIVNNDVFVVHGGLARENHLVAELENRNKTDLIFHEFFWNDPSEKNGITSNPRGDGVFRFGPNVTESFLKTNRMKLIIRSHEMVEEGFAFSQKGQCLTVFSAPNYAGHFRNKGAFATLTAGHAGTEVECTQFTAAGLAKL